MAAITKEEKIKCGRNLGEKTKEDCRNCDFSNLDDCPAGAYHAWRP